MPQTMQDEARLFDGSEIRAVETKKARVFEGRAVPYGEQSWALINGLFEERIAKGAFSKSLTESAARLPLMLAHRLDELPLGSLETWEERDDGLYGVWRMADHATAAWESVASGDLSGLSVHFRPVRDDWQLRDSPEFSRVTRLEAQLREVSLCAIPTWQEARVTMTRTAKGAPIKTPRLNRWQDYRATL